VLVWSTLKINRLGLRLTLARETINESIWQRVCG
jgi:hypothetical protein